tara:strand:+ start:1295 stop:1528 length:234 start_codon:yes stop_codon:yes gene_type:complete
MTDTIKTKKVLVGDSYVDVPNTDKDSVIQNLRQTINSQAQIIAELSRIRYQFDKAVKEMQVTLNDLKQSIYEERNDR